MDLVNDTPLPAVLIRNAEASDFITGLVIACATYAIGDDGLVLSERQRPITVTSPTSLAGDAHFEKSGASICATGYVYAQNGEAKSSDAMLLVGELTQRVRALGCASGKRACSATSSPPRPRGPSSASR